MPELCPPAQFPHRALPFSTLTGVFADDGAFHPLESWDADAVMKLFLVTVKTASVLARQAIWSR